MIALLFPGQGAQSVGMGEDFAKAFFTARATFEEADDLLKESLSSLIFQGPLDALTETRNSQLAIFVTSMAIFRVVSEQWPELSLKVAAGLSLGEYTALCATERLSFKEALFLIQKRAHLMNEACKKQKGTMAAILGLSAPEVEKAIQNLEGVWVANYNAPGQTVISGTEKGVEIATQALKTIGARRILPLTVHGAFHSGLMQSAQTGLAPFIAQTSFHPSSTALVMNVTGQFAYTEEEIRRNLTSQVTGSVRWEQGILSMQQKEVTLYVEMGPGKTLSGLNKKIGVKAPTHSVEKVSDLELLGALCTH